ncbi:MAG: hypothetical protein L0Y58_09030 [Verrucomicrobia subdivision 3 bacterium]|nr:hypothetical protein [Limisphaerales bacterium]
MSKKAISEPSDPASETSPLGPKAPRMPIFEDLARREKTPFIMTSTGRTGKRALGWEVGQAMHFSPDEPS